MTWRRISRTMILVIATVLAVASAAAQAAPVKECGNYDYASGFTSQPIQGAGVYNITARVISCISARRVMLRSHRKWNSGVNASDGWWINAAGRRFSCRLVEEGHEYLDARCTASGGRVARWQEGS